MSTTTTNTASTTSTTNLTAHRETAAKLCTILMERTLTENYGFRKGEKHSNWMEYVAGSISHYTKVTISKPTFDKGFDECLKLYSFVTIKTFCENGYPEMFDDSELCRQVPLTYLPKFIEEKAHLHTKEYWEKFHKELNLG